MATHQTKYTIGDVVYLRVNDERKPGMITIISIRPHGYVLYCVVWRGGSETWHSDFELSTEYVPDWCQDSAAVEGGK